jgi:NAD(P)-dependent dehydrogenase (short-subunit alcohol dehydrogenase family)
MKGVALITGATGGLGTVIARKMAAAGYQLILHFFRNEEKAKLLAASLHLNGREHVVIGADLRSENEIRSMVQSAIEQTGGINILVNNAGIPFSGLSWKQSAEDWEEVFRVNTTAPWLVSKYCIPSMREQQTGRIIYFSSVVAHRPPAGTTAYAASKAALEGLTRAQAIELSRFGITVNCIAPGYFNTGMISSVDENIRKEIIHNTPLQRLGIAEELAGMVTYLSEENSGYITGQVMHVNGGLYI